MSLLANALTLCPELGQLLLKVFQTVGDLLHDLVLIFPKLIRHLLFEECLASRVV
jgi:hypothetical protein